MLPATGRRSVSKDIVWFAIKSFLKYKNKCGYEKIATFLCFVIILFKMETQKYIRYIKLGLEKKDKINKTL